MIDLTVAQIADIVGGRLADIRPEQPRATRVTGTVEFDSRAWSRAGCFSRCRGAAPTATTSRAAAVRRAPSRCWPRGRSACPRSSSHLN
jgi:UDP-N-acetylmuramoyl-tripeptide--D-alanyl-D-alanine ligase